MIEKRAGSQFWLGGRSHWLLVAAILMVAGCGKNEVAQNKNVTAPDGRAMMAAESPLNSGPLNSGPLNSGSLDAMPAEFADDPTDEGQGPGMSGDKHDLIVDNPFLSTRNEPLSTFSVDVDTASYSKIRSYLLGQSRLPRKDAVRIEELVNYFDYDYPQPEASSSDPFVASVAIAECPWQPAHQLARIAIKGVEPQAGVAAGSNLVFLVDVSGSMKRANKLPLLKQALRLLVDELGADDRVSLVVYAGASGVVLSGASGADKTRINDALGRLAAGGSTNGAAGIDDAYRLARENFIEGGNNRVILCSDGDFNVGRTGTDQLVRMIEDEAKSNIFLTVLGFGMGNHNDAMMEQISGRGNGNYFFIDTIREAQKVLVQDMQSTLVTIAKDVKLQLEFNPAKVAAYRLIGYENRVLESQDFNDDKKDAGEIGAGHCVTALYELVPPGVPLPSQMTSVDPLRYQTRTSPVHADQAEPTDALESSLSDEWLVIRLRYKFPSEDVSQRIEFVVRDQAVPFTDADADMQFAAAVAAFGMLLRESPYRGDANYEQVLAIAQASIGSDPFGMRREFCDLVRAAKVLN